MSAIRKVRTSLARGRCSTVVMPHHARPRRLAGRSVPVGGMTYTEPRALNPLRRKEPDDPTQPFRRQPGGIVRGSYGSRSRYVDELSPGPYVETVTGEASLVGWGSLE